ncbi:hypothetical protein FJT64_014645 [Amphibalanus amphitrite]|uniref:Uncharacterized protein n=1 Tax=Amphibalanus amphitrite TaxID=1232801 RepID=A0A6A4V984_AMPAM|nr:hypothetical protein FJT64_014645 [Amphibalanus amphitrite]
MQITNKSSLITTFSSDSFLLFSDKGGFKPTDIESEKADTNGHGEAAGRNGLGAIPPDALYAGPKKPPQGIASYESNTRPRPQFCGDEDERPDQPTVYSTSFGGGGGIIYADLQLPRASNNGSMRKLRQARRPCRQEDATPSAAPPAVEYAVIKFPSKAGVEGERTQV